MRTSLSTQELRDAYRFPGFVPNRLVVAMHGDDEARILHLTRRAKKQPAVPAALSTAPGTITACSACAISPMGDLRIYLEMAVHRVACRTCGRVRQERLDWLAANPHYTKRFALYVNRRPKLALRGSW